MSVNTLFGSCFLRLQQRLFVAGCLWPTYRGELFLFVRKRWRRGVLPKRWGGRCLAHATPGFWRAVSGGKNEMLYKTAWKKVCQDVALLFSYCNELYGCLSNITPLCCVLLSRRSVGEYSTKKDEKKKTDTEHPVCTAFLSFAILKFFLAQLLPFPFMAANASSWVAGHVDYLCCVGLESMFWLQGAVVAKETQVVMLVWK